MTPHHPAETNLFHVQNIHPVDPGAGAQYAVTITDLGRQQLTNVSFLLTTSVAVANRYATVRISSQGRIFVRAVYPVPITAGQTIFAHFAIGLQPVESLDGAARIINAPLPSHVITPPVNIFSIQIDNMDAGDEIVTIAMWYRHWHQCTFI